MKFHFFCSISSMEKFRYLTKLRCLAKISIFDQNFTQKPILKPKNIIVTNHVPIKFNNFELTRSLLIYFKLTYP